MSEALPLNLTPVHIVGAISIEAKQVSALIDACAAKGVTIDMGAVKAAINRMVGLANAVGTPAPAEPVAGE